ncbi:MAG: hypothetical protein PHE02_14060, partial [Lachnospiraceae bacterium]|nr:hypothetical protein [Lachnospiraceae bacterium]
GSPIIAENVIVCDGAKILGPVVIGTNSIVAAGAIITKDIPQKSIAYGVNQCKPKNQNYDFVYGNNLPNGKDIMEIDRERIQEFTKSKN